jgi:hypothetical protein
MANVAWNKDISDIVRMFTVFTQEDAFDAFEGAAVDVATAIMEDTPLGVTPSEGGTKGNLRNNWQIGRSDNSTVLLGRNANKGKSYAKSKLQGSLRGKKGSKGLYLGGQRMFMFNNAPQTLVVEYGDYPNPVKKGTYLNLSKRFEKRSEGGFSKQAPRGMFRLNKQKFNKFFENRYAIV